ncbi:MAG: ribonuclease HIII [Aquificaceae bacterium]
MSNQTIKIPKERAQAIKQELIKAGFRERALPNALWSLTDGENHVLFYSSGTLLLQGKESGRLKDLILSLLPSYERIMVGCDESGKGDVFGPLVLCCAVIKPEYYKKVLELNYRDCKMMKDEEVLKKAKEFMAFGEFICKLVEPLELNKLYEQEGNLNRILDGLYKNLLKGLREKYPKEEFYIDAYAKRNPFGRDVVFEHKGEENIAVAVASVLARSKFLQWLRERNLPKGSSIEALSLAKKVYQEDREKAKKLLKVFFLLTRPSGPPTI